MKIYEVSAAPDCEVDDYGFVRGFWCIRIDCGGGVVRYSMAIDKDAVAGVAVDLLRIELSAPTRSFAVTATYLDHVPDSWRRD